MDLTFCTNWFCTKGTEKAPNVSTDYQTVVTTGPGPSPGSSNSCDDVVPHQKNCFRLVMLGKP